MLPPDKRGQHRITKMSFCIGAAAPLAPALARGLSRLRA